MNSADQEEAEFANDAKFRTYASNVDRALKAFETSAEWADLIAALGKLSKLLQGSTKFPVIPRKLLVGKRLSQCLHPVLPAGVHLKALECYDFIFRNIGPTRLATNLPVFCPGLFPLLGYSSMTVKTPLFDIYETHFLPLGLSLRPAFTGLLQGLLPGLEEGAEFYDRSQRLLEKFSESVGPAFFHTCLWQVMLQAPSCRGFGVGYLLNHVDKKASSSNTDPTPYISVTTFLGNNINLMLLSICATLGDTQVLVQRSALDLLLFCIPMHQQELLNRADRVTLCAAALCCLLRRDMSLNRRLCNWLTGAQLTPTQLLHILSEANTTDPKEPGQINVKLTRSLSESESELHQQYFIKFGKSILADGVKEVIRHPISVIGDRLASVRPFRIITSLMDLQFLGSSVIEDVLLDLILFMQEEFIRIGDVAKQQKEGAKVFSAVIAARQSQGVNNDSPSSFPSDSSENLGPTNRSSTALSSTQEDFLKTANLFFANLDSAFLWGFLKKLLDESSSANRHCPHATTDVGLTLCELCGVLDFLLRHLPIETYSEVPSYYLPQMMLQIVELLTQRCTDFTLTEVEKLLDLAAFLFVHILQHTVAASSSYIPKVASGTEVSTSSAQQQRRDAEIMVKIIEGYRSFFENFCKTKLKISQNHITGCMNTLKKAGTPHRIFDGGLQETSLGPPLPCLSLSSLLEGNEVHTYEEVALKSVQNRQRSSTLPTQGEQAYLVSIFGKICKLLIEMISYPLSGNDLKNDKSENKDVVPGWLDCLCITAVFVDQFAIKTVSISALLDLLHATLSTHGTDKLLSPLAKKSSTNSLEQPPQQASKLRIWDKIAAARSDSNSEDPSGRNSLSATQTKVVLITFPTLSPEVLQYLYHKTSLFRLTAQSLWQYLSNDKPQCHQRAVSLLLKLNELSPPLAVNDGLDSPRRSTALCEDLMLSEMLNENLDRALDAQNRFLVVWHLQHQLHLHKAVQTVSTPGKNSHAVKQQADQNKGSTTRLLSGFDKCLFVLLDGLQEKQSMEMARQNLSTEWLQQAIVCGEMPRIFEPLLLGLLEAHTVRLSILTVSHVWNPESSWQITNSMDNNNGSKRSSICALNRNASYAHELDLLDAGKNKYDDQFANGLHIVNVDDLGLDMEESSEEVVREILEEILQRVCRECESHVSTMDTDDILNFSESPETHRVRNNSNRHNLTDLLDKTSIMNTSTTTLANQSNMNVSVSTPLVGNPSTTNRVLRAASVLPIHTHILIYRNCSDPFDWPRTLYLLGRLKAIFNSAPRTGVRWCLITLLHPTSNGSAKEINGGTPPLASRPTETCGFAAASFIPSLLAKHRNALSGGNFYQNTTSEQLNQFRRMSYAECILHICLSYVRTFFWPPNLNWSKNVSALNSVPSTNSNNSLEMGISFIGAGAGGPRTHAELHEYRLGNRRVQLLALDCLQLLLQEFITLVLSRESLLSPTRTVGLPSELAARATSLFLTPIMSAVELRINLWQLSLRLKLSPVILQSLAASVLLRVTNQATSTPSDSEDSSTAVNVSCCILQWNEVGLKDTHWWRCYQQVLMNTCLTILRLEAALFHDTASLHSNSQNPTSNASVASLPRIDNFTPPKAFNLLAWDEILSVKFQQNVPMACQNLLVSTIVSALRDPFQRETHASWCNFLLRAQPYWGRALITVLPHVLRALTRCLRQAVWDYTQCVTIRSHKSSCYCDTDIQASPPLSRNKMLSSLALQRLPSKSTENEVTNPPIITYPPEYCLTILECIQGLIHSVLLLQTVESITGSAATSSNAGGSSSEAASAFAWFYRSKESGEKENSENEIISAPAYVVEARHEVLRLFPRLILSLACLWRAVIACEEVETIDPQGNPISVFKQEASATDMSCLSLPAHQQSATIMGDRVSVHRGILQLLAPLSQGHLCANGSITSQTLISAVAGCWRAFGLASGTSSINAPNNKPDKYTATKDQEALVDMMRSLFSTEALVLSMNDLIRNAVGMTLATVQGPLRVEVPRLPQSTHLSFPDNCIQLGQERLVSPSLIQSCMLQFIFCLCCQQTTNELRDYYNVYMTLMKDIVACQLQPVGYFILLKIFGEFLSKVPISDDKKDQKDIQELSHRIIEAVALVASSSLEQSSWFRRGVQVKLDDVDVSPPMKNTQSQVASNGLVPSNGVNVVSNLPKDIRSDDSNSQQKDLETSFLSSDPRALIAREQSILPSNRSEASLREKTTSTDSPAVISHRVNTVQALELLTSHMSAIFDIVYRSEERDRVATILSSSVLPSVFPYLRLRSLGNLSNLRASSHLLASISGYQYTRKAWRKEIFDMLFENNFFQFDLATMRSWVVIIDNLMTQDKNTFKEALAKLPITAPGALTLFVSREAEYEQRAACIKKLAYILFASEKDQYIRSVAELLERLTECLRMGVVPQTHAQVFLCFRVLLVRISPNHLTSQWQNILQELMHVFQLMRQEFIDMSQKNADVTDSRSSNNRVRATSTAQSQKHLTMYLSACKLLDFALLMSEEVVPQFQFFKWNFVGDRDACEPDSRVKRDLQPAFRPIVVEIADIILRTPCLREGLAVCRDDLTSEMPLVYDSSIGSLLDLVSFLVTLSMRHDSQPLQRLASLNVPVRHFTRGTLSSNSNAANMTNSTSIAASIRFQAMSGSISLNKVLEQVMELDFIETVPK